MTIKEIQDAMSDKHLLMDGYDVGAVARIAAFDPDISGYLCVMTDKVPDDGFPLRQDVLESLCKNGLTAYQVKERLTEYKLMQPQGAQLELTF